MTYDDKTLESFFQALESEEKEEEKKRLLKLLSSDKKRRLEAETKADSLYEKKLLKIKEETDGLLGEKRRLDALERRRRLLTARREALDAVFGEAEKKLAAFKKTPEYDRFLIEGIKKASKYSGSKELTVFLNGGDIEKVGKNTGCKIKTERDDSFSGGFRAQCVSARLVFDSSFDSLLREQREVYEKGGFLTIKEGADDEI